MNVADVQNILWLKIEKKINQDLRAFWCQTRERSSESPGQGEEQVIPLAVFEEHDLNSLVGEAGRIASGNGAHADRERALRVRERVTRRPLPEGEHQRQRRLHLCPPPPRGLRNRGGKQYCGWILTLVHHTTKKTRIRTS